MNPIRLRVLLWMFAALFAVVEGRLVHLQFVTRSFWEGEALASRTGGRSSPFRRGAIYDRYGRALAIGETNHTLSFVFADFRRETPVGQVIGAARLLLAGSDDGLGRDLVRDVLARPDEWLRYVLNRTEAGVEQRLPQDRTDFLFYVRRLLELSESEFRDLRKRGREENLTFEKLVPKGLAAASERIREQRQSIADLAGSIERTPDELVALVDAVVKELDQALARSVKRHSTAPNVKQMRAMRKDYENRARVLQRVVPYRAVYLVNLVPERFTGFEIRDVDSRVYPDAYASLSPVLIGWVGYPDAAELEKTDEDSRKYQELRARSPELIDTETAEHIEALKDRLRHVAYGPDEEQGKEGVEALLEPLLRGKRGWRVVEKDSSHQDTKLLEGIPPVAGLDAYLTLDAELQLACERTLEQNAHASAIALIDPNDGAIRALATWPNPSRKDLREKYAELAADPQKPLQQRAYRPPGNPPPPGSVFKLVAAAAGLENGIIGPHTELTCEEHLTVGRVRLKCLFHHGSIGVVKALEKSCNLFFYKMARELKLDPLVEMARRFGLGVATGFGDPKVLGLPDGAVSLREIPCKIDTSDHSVVNTMRSAIGQAAFDDITPLQVAMMVAPYANGGKRVRPWLVDRVGDRKLPRTPPEPIGLKRSTIDTVREGMIAVAETGTARADKGFDLKPYRVAAKTGTPQAANELDHAWIAGFLPYDKPVLAFAVFFENIDAHGGDVGVPVLGQFLEQPETQAFLAQNGVVVRDRSVGKGGK